MVGRGAGHGAAEVAAIADAIARRAARRVRPRVRVAGPARADAVPRSGGVAPEHAAWMLPPSEIVAPSPRSRLLDPLAADVAPVVRALAGPSARRRARRRARTSGCSRRGSAPTHAGHRRHPADGRVRRASATRSGSPRSRNELLGVVAREGAAVDRLGSAARCTDAQLAYADGRRPPPAGDLRHARRAARAARSRGCARRAAQIVADAIAAAARDAGDRVAAASAARAASTRAAHAALVALAALAPAHGDRARSAARPGAADKALVELARHRPSNAGGVRAVEGHVADRARRAPTRSSRRSPAAQAGGRRRRARAACASAASARAQRWAEMLLAIVQLVAEETGIAARLLATRARRRGARAHRRRARASTPRARCPRSRRGAARCSATSWEGWLAGRVALVGDAAAPHGIRLDRR